MTPLFGDTWYFLSLLNEEDPAHRDVVEYSALLTRPVLTTDWVLVELGDAFSAPQNRTRFVAFVKSLKSNPRFRIVRAGTDLDAGMELFSRRPDNSWSLTDCISFQIMRRRKLHEALTADRHFEQVGFKAVFLP